MLNRINSLHAELISLIGTKPSQSTQVQLSSLHGYAFALACLVSSLSRGDLGIPLSLREVVLQRAKSLIAITDADIEILELSTTVQIRSHLDLVGLSIANAGWLLLSGLVCQGVSWCSIQLHNLNDPWGSALGHVDTRNLPKTGSKHFSWHLMYITSAVSSLHAFLALCPELVQVDSVKTYSQTEDRPSLAMDVALYMQNAVQILRWAIQDVSSYNPIAKEYVAALHCEVMETLSLMPHQLYQTTHPSFIEITQNLFLCGIPYVSPAHPMAFRCMFTRDLLNPSDNALCYATEEFDDTHGARALHPLLQTVHISDVEANSYSFTYLRQPDTGHEPQCLLVHRTINAAVRLHSAIILGASVSQRKEWLIKLQEQLTTIKESRSLFRARPFLGINVCSALLLALRLIQNDDMPNTSSRSTIWLEPIKQILFVYLSDQDPLVRQCAAEALSVAASIGGENFSRDIIRALEQLVKTTDLNTRAGGVFALACTHREIGAMRNVNLVSSSMKILFEMARGVIEPVRSAVLHSWWIMIHTSGLALERYSPVTLKLLAAHLIADSPIQDRSGISAGITADKLRAGILLSVAKILNAFVGKFN